MSATSQLNRVSFSQCAKALATPKMIKTSSIVFFFLAFIFLAGCSNTATLDRVALQKNKISQIQLKTPEKLVVFSGGAKQAVGVEYGLAGMFVSAIIDDAINTNRVTVLDKMTKKLNYNVQQHLANKLSRLSGPAFKAGTRVMRYGTKDKLPELPLFGLRVVSKTAIAPNHQSIFSRATFNLHSDAKTKDYSKEFEVETKIPLNLKPNQRINVTQYLTDNPQVLRKTIDQTLNSLVAKIANDLNAAKK